MFARFRPLLPAGAAAAGLVAQSSHGGSYRRDWDRFRSFAPPFQAKLPTVTSSPVSSFLSRDGGLGLQTRSRYGFTAPGVFNNVVVRCMDDDKDALEREAKRARFDAWTMWELSPMRRLREDGDGLQIQADGAAQATSLREKVTAVVDAIRLEHPSWNDYSPELKGAVVLLEFANKATWLDWESNLWKTKLLMAILLDIARAHESGGFTRVNNVWQPCGEGFPSDVIDFLENTTKLAMSMVARRFDDLDAAPEGPRGPIIRQIAEDPLTIQREKRDLLDAGKKIKEGAGEGWAKKTLSDLSTLCPTWSKGGTIYNNFCKWGFTPRPAHNGLIAFEDCVLAFAEQITQKQGVHDVYFAIPQKLDYKPSDAFVSWFRKCMTTTIAGDMATMELEFAIESLAIRGLRLPRHCVPSGHY